MAPMFLLLLTATKALEDGSAAFYQSSVAHSNGDNSTAIKVLLSDAVKMVCWTRGSYATRTAVSETRARGRASSVRRGSPAQSN